MRQGVTSWKLLLIDNFSVTTTTPTQVNEVKDSHIIQKPHDKLNNRAIKLADKERSNSNNKAEVHLLKIRWTLATICQGDSCGCVRQSIDFRSGNTSTASIYHHRVGSSGTRGTQW